MVKPVMSSISTSRPKEELSSMTLKRRIYIVSIVQQVAEPST
jgi:hypothetical protein